MGYWVNHGDDFHGYDLDQVEDLDVGDGVEDDILFPRKVDLLDDYDVHRLVKIVPLKDPSDGLAGRRWLVALECM